MELSKKVQLESRFSNFQVFSLFRLKFLLLQVFHAVSNKIRAFSHSKTLFYSTWNVFLNKILAIFVLS